jgi:zinc carboxypeptidase
MARRWALVAVLTAAGAALALPPPLAAQDAVPGRDPAQPIDQAYTQKILAYTTAPYFSSPLVDYLPASANVPTPEAVLGDVAGAPGILPYSADVARYMRMLAAASPRVKVVSIGRSEEGREMIAVAISSEQNLEHLDENRARLAKLGDPRTIGMDDAAADRLVSASVPVYYITGALHSSETGAPTALMELAYRLAVDESPYIRDIREHMITLITPVVEVDGRDRMVDVYRWHLAHPGLLSPPAIYWGKYVEHDNNRDAMALTLKVTQNVLATYLGWDAQVLHDLHESYPYLYDDTAGDGPFNAWVDPILTNEWEVLGWRNVADMTAFGMPGVYTHGDLDTWSPAYMMFLAATHNGISRLYETFGNDGADTIERTLLPADTNRTWYKQNPPLGKTLWSQRDNNNYEETGLLTTLHYFEENRALFLKNFYLKSKRSVEKPTLEGPAAYVFPADDPRPGLQARLLQILARQGCEISRARAAFRVSLVAPAQAAATQGLPTSVPPESGAAETAGREFPAGSYIVRMDQPYSRVADALLDYQYWSPTDARHDPSDDTGWTLGELFDVQVVRVADPKILDAPMDRVADVRAPSGVSGTGTIYLIDDNGDPALASLRYRLRDALIDAAEEPFDADGRTYRRGTFIVRGGASAENLSAALADLGLSAIAVTAAPDVKAHPVRAARVAVMHTWQRAMTEGWWRLALDTLGIPYDYISTQTVAASDNLNAKYDVILFPPADTGGDVMSIVRGMPADWGNPLPWKATPDTPNLGTPDSTDDMRPGLGWAGVEHLEQFVEHGGVLVTAADTAQFAAQLGLARGVSVTQPDKLRLVGSVVRTRKVDEASPIAYGYDDTVSAYASGGPIFAISNFASGASSDEASGEERPTGRGTSADTDFTPGRSAAPAATSPASAAATPKTNPWEAPPVLADDARNNPDVIPPAERPRVVFRYGGSNDGDDALLVSGLLDHGDEIAQHASVIDVPEGQGHVILFSTNPIYRGETVGSYSLVLKTILNFDSLNVGRTLSDK